MNLKKIPATIEQEEHLWDDCSYEKASEEARSWILKQHVSHGENSGTYDTDDEYENEFDGRVVLLTSKIEEGKQWGKKYMAWTEELPLDANITGNNFLK